MSGSVEKLPDGLGASGAASQAMTPRGPVRPGDRVRLVPAGCADILDLALAGKTATVEAIEQDLENRLYVAVVLDDDPGKELGQMRQAAHCFFFRPEELELLDEPDRGAP